MSMTGCKYDVAFRGPCGLPTSGGEMCETHARLRCASCGASAVRECDASIGVVCGYPLCGDCQHSITQRHVSRAQAERDYLQWQINDQQARVDRAQEKLGKLRREMEAKGDDRRPT